MTSTGAAESLGAIIGLVIVLLILGAIGSLIGAILLRAAAKWVLKRDVAFGHAFVTVLIAYVINIAVSLLVGLVIVSIAAAMAASAETRNAIMEWAPYATGFVVQAAVIAWRLKIGFGRACLVTLVMFATMAALVLAIGFVIGIIAFIVFSFASI